jgi:hypothetical protein
MVAVRSGFPWVEPGQAQRRPRIELQRDMVAAWRGFRWDKPAEPNGSEEWWGLGHQSDQEEVDSTTCGMR